MLIGSYRHVVDPKGRVFIPSKWRGELGDSVIVMRGITASDEGKCLRAYSQQSFMKTFEKLNDLPVTDVLGNRFKRQVLASAGGCEPDKQGRILLAPKLIEYAGIGDEVVLVGMSDCFEIWNAEVWDASEEGFSAEEWTQALDVLAGRGI